MQQCPPGRVPLDPTGDGRASPVVYREAALVLGNLLRHHNCHTANVVVRQVFRSDRRAGLDGTDNRDAPA